MKISIISAIYILNDKMVDVTKDMIIDINKTRPKDSEFIIVDNASTYGIDEMIKGCDIYVKLKENRGWGGGLNVGMKLAKGDYFVFVNNDIRINEEWAKPLLERFNNVPKTGAISIHNRSGFSGAFFGIRRKVYEEIGLFDEKNFPLGHAQDCDYLYRLMRKGWDIYVVVLNSFKHVPRSTYNQPEFKKKYLDNPNYSKSPFQEKWGIKESEWYQKGREYWRNKIRENPSLDRFGELKTLEQIDEKQDFQNKNL